MNRRRFVLGLGGTGIGGSALLGSGAFSSVRSNRAVKVAVVGDADAYLRLTPENEHFVTLDNDGQLELAVDLARDRSAELYPLISVANHGKQRVCVWIDEKIGADPDRITFVTGAGNSSTSIEGSDRGIPIDVGESLAIGISVETADVETVGAILERVTIRAGLDCPGVSESAWTLGESFSGPNWAMYSVFEGEELDVPLVAGSDLTPVGTVSVNQGMDSLSITYQTEGGWRLETTHLHVADTVKAIPTTNGNPIPGQFSYAGYHDPALENVQYVVDSVGPHGIPISEFEGSIFLAAHAVVSHHG